MPPQSMIYHAFYYNLHYYYPRRIIFILVSKKIMNMYKDILYTYENDILGIICIKDNNEDLFKKLKIKDISWIAKQTAVEGKFNIMRYLIEECNFDISDDNHSVIQLASHYGHLEMVKYLHKRGADIRALDDYCISWAAHEGHLEIVKYLHDNGAPATDNGLIWASGNGHIEIVKYLYTLKVYGLRILNISLIQACQYNHVDIVKYLHENVDNIDKGREAVYNAAENGCYEIIKYLIDNGWDYNIMKAGMLATYKGSINIVDYLCQKGLNPCAKELTIEAADKENIEMLEYLRSKGADLSIYDNYAINRADRTGNSAMLKYLKGVLGITD